MIGASKILTVSYGTFSCTLEGFDEPFGTMKAIAEYFRDLAADDRYFGAEPPIPDAAMLHRIAEREIHRRVEAKIQDNGVVLRAGPAADRDSLPVPIAAPTASLQPGTPASVPGSGPVESVAAKLMRIRAAALADDASREAAEAVAPAVDAEPSTGQDAVAAFAESTTTASIPGFAALADQGHDPEPAPDMASMSAETAAEALASSETPAVLSADDVAADDGSADDASDVRIAGSHAFDATITDEGPGDRDFAEDWLDEPVAEAPVVAIGPWDGDDAAHDDMAADDGPDMAAVPVEDLVEHLAGPVAEVETADVIQLFDVTGTTAAPDVAKAPPAETAVVPPLTPLTDLFPEDDLDDEPAEATLARSWHDIDGDDLDADVDAEFDAAPDADDARPAPLAAVALRTDDAEDDLAAALAEEPLLLDEPIVKPVAAAVEPTPAPGAAAHLRNPDAMDKIQRARARVIKIRRVGTGDGAIAAPTGLTAEAEATLARALEDDRAAARAAAQPAPGPVLPTRPVRRPAVADGADPDVDDSVNRLLAQTATEMDVPEQRRRRSAIEHLKAAVAATIADRRVGGPLPPSEQELIDPYRSDLSEMVGVGPTATAPRSTPLVLVSEQRIDRLRTGPDADAAPGTVRARRVGATPLALRDIVMNEDDAEDEDEDAGHPVDPHDFAVFAARLDARSLPDLLEAAAAYTAIVEGRPHFSRPHLMRQVGTVVTDVDFTRETGLRGFGTLLRTGRILRVKRGQYALAEGSRYMTDMAGE